MTVSSSARGHVRRARLTGATVMLSALLAATASCVAAPTPTPTVTPPAPSSSGSAPAPSSSGSAPGVDACLGDVSHPELDVQALNLSLPVADVLDDFVQAELLIERGQGTCRSAPPGLGMVEPRCEPLVSTPQDSLNVMLWSSADALTEAMFAAGADRALSETVTGFSGSTANTFTYRMTAWRFVNKAAPQDTPVWGMLSECDGVVQEMFLGNDRLVLRAGADVALIVSHSDDIVYLVESIAPLSPEGEPQRYSGTASGLLPTSALNAIQAWWHEVTPGQLDVARPGPTA